jgi:hypothetical protein
MGVKINRKRTLKPFTGGDIILLHIEAFSKLIPKIGVLRFFLKCTCKQFNIPFCFLPSGVQVSLIAGMPDSQRNRISLNLRCGNRYELFMYDAFIAIVFF